MLYVHRIYSKNYFLVAHIITRNIHFFIPFIKIFRNWRFFLYTCIFLNIIYFWWMFNILSGNRFKSSMEERNTRAIHRLKRLTPLFEFFKILVLKHSIDQFSTKIFKNSKSGINHFSLRTAHIMYIYITNLYYRKI